MYLLIDDTVIFRWYYIYNSKFRETVFSKVRCNLYYQYGSQADLGKRKRVIPDVIFKVYLSNKLHVNIYTFKICTFKIFTLNNIQ